MDVYEAIFNRRSITKFKEKPVPREVLERVLEAALWAPSMQDMQNWYFVVLGGAAKKRLLATIQLNFAKLLSALEESFPWTSVRRTDWFLQAAAQAPVLIAVFSDVKVERCLDCALSVAAAVQNLLLAAWSEGLGTRWFTSGLYAISESISSVLGVKDKDLIGLIVLGYPEEIPQPSPRRKNRVEWRLS